MRKIPRVKVSRTNLPADDIKTFHIGDAQLAFGFKYFHGESIRFEGFNNFYKNCFEAISAFKDFHQAVAELSKMTVKEAFDIRTKRQLHLHPIEAMEADKVDQVLAEGYSFPQALIDEFREGQYFEFSFSDGQRAIAIRHDFILEPLFLDPNHMIYADSCRNYKEKLLYNSPSILSSDAEESVLKELTE